MTVNALRHGLAIILFFLLSPASGQSQLLGQPQPQALTISKIIITNVGPQAVSESLIRANIRVKEGDLYGRQIDDDVNNLYATGYFHDIRVAEELVDNGVVLTYFLQGKPTITEIQFTGNRKFSNNKLRKN